MVPDSALFQYLVRTRPGAIASLVLRLDRFRSRPLVRLIAWGLSTLLIMTAIIGVIVDWRPFTCIVGRCAPTFTPTDVSTSSATMILEPALDVTLSVSVRTPAQSPTSIPTPTQSPRPTHISNPAPIPTATATSPRTPMQTLTSTPSQTPSVTTVLTLPPGDCEPAMYEELRQAALSQARYIEGNLAFDKLVETWGVMAAKAGEEAKKLQSQSNVKALRITKVEFDFLSCQVVSRVSDRRSVVITRELWEYEAELECVGSDTTHPSKRNDEYPSETYYLELGKQGWEITGWELGWVVTKYWKCP